MVETVNQQQSIIIIEDDILNAKEQYIVHQCNCVTDKAKGLAQALFKKYPYSDIYSQRTQKSKPGTIDIKGNGKDQRYIINLFGQYYPGQPKYPNDNVSKRLEYFENGLEKIKSIKNLQSLAFPYKIGCGLAGGSWEDYLKLLQKFASNCKDVKIVIYQKNN